MRDVSKKKKSQKIVMAVPSVVFCFLIFFFFCVCVSGLFIHNLFLRSVELKKKVKSNKKKKKKKENHFVGVLRFFLFLLAVFAALLRNYEKKESFASV